MEEEVGQFWHRFISRTARVGHAEAGVALEDVAHPVGVLFRALGGDGGLRVEATNPTEHGARRRWLQRVAGTGHQVELAWRDERALRLPSRIDVFPDPALNRDLYLWLAALAAQRADTALPWLVRNQRLTVEALRHYPGLAPRYRRLAEAQLALRPDPDALPQGEQAPERAIRAALAEPGSVAHLPAAPQPPQPVFMWLHPSPPIPLADTAKADPEEAESGDSTRESENQRRRAAQRTNAPQRGRGLLAVRLESILGWGEFAKVDRDSEENEDLGEAARTAKDMDVLSVARDAQRTSSRLRFDLDLPAASHDDLVLEEGIPLPEWDYKHHRLQPDHCRLQTMIAADAVPQDLPDHLRRTARQLRDQFQALAPGRIWLQAQPDGSEVDLDAYISFAAERAAGHAATEQGLYRDLRPGARDLACLLLADLSLSTDAWVNNSARVIDVVRDSLFLFSESLAATGDQFALYGFSSRRRNHIRFHHIKGFGERYDGRVRGRIQALKPGYYTRMGAAIRHSTHLLAEQPAGHRLLLLLTDGKPNDLDHYEGRYGVEDTRVAIIEARRQGLKPFCVTIDEQANDYLPHLFGKGGYVVIRRPSELPRELPLLYSRLTR